MELLLNFAWMLLAAGIVCHWLQIQGREPAGRRLSFIALVMLIVILFPAISVSDDLQSIQNPAEINSGQRRAHLATSPHSVFPAITALPELVFAEATSCFQRFAAPVNLPLIAVENPAFVTIQNRPPPAA